MSIPTVAIIGRMNVGKSTLFNRLTESEKAIISSWAGTTRDVNTSRVIWRGHEFDLVDTGGMDVEDDEQLEERVIQAAHRAMDTADLLLFVIDGTVGVLPQEKQLVDAMRAKKIPTILVVNKMDNPTKRNAIPNNVFQLPFEQRALVSSKNGRGTGDLLDLIYETIEPMDAKDGEAPKTKVAIVGQPNVGKSSILNAILGEERVIVADLAHTTRDTNDIAYTYKERDFLLIDTAGIRRRSNVGKRWSDKRLGQIEKESVRAAIAAMKRADVVLLVIEAQERVTAQDKKIAELANQYGKGLIVVVNKWDLIEEKDSNTITEFTVYFDQALPFLRWAPIIFISAEEKLRVRDTLDLVVQVAENYERELTLEELEPVLQVVKKNYNPKLSNVRKFKRRPAELKRIKQIGKRPPHFYLKTTRPDEIPSAIPNIIEREIRDMYEFDGVRIIIEIGT